MARPLRLDHAGGIWHITSRGNERRRIFRSDDDRRAFLSYLGRAAGRAGWIVHDYKLMPNHYHLVIETPEPTLSKGMHWLNGCYAMWFNRKHKRVGHLFQGRFNGILVESGEYLLEVSRYVVLNAVRARLVREAKDDPWSSYRARAGYEPPPPWLEVDALLDQIHPDRAEAQRIYRKMIETVERIPSPWPRVSGQMYLGSEAFLNRVRERLAEKLWSDEHPLNMRKPRRPDIEKILDVVARESGIPVSRLIHGRGGTDRQLLAHLAWNVGHLRLGDIAATLGVRSRGHVSELVKRGERLRHEDPEFRRTAEACDRALAWRPTSCLART